MTACDVPLSEMPRVFRQRPGTHLREPLWRHPRRGSRAGCHWPTPTPRAPKQVRPAPGIFLDLRRSSGAMTCVQRRDAEPVPDLLHVGCSTPSTQPGMVRARRGTGARVWWTSRASQAGSATSRWRSWNDAVFRMIWNLCPSWHPPRDDLRGVAGRRLCATLGWRGARVRRGPEPLAVDGREANEHRERSPHALRRTGRLALVMAGCAMRGEKSPARPS